ncbi:MAG: hypothetical protein HUJ86_07260, partial [Synergistes sp.]|nr:hypothetical protein [Synergistes sp.]
FVDAKECFVPDGAAITGAVGAAVSSLALSCSVYVKHNFFDGEYYAFLPTKRIKGSNFNEVCDEARRELKEHLKKQAVLMGFKESTAEITESVEYADKECIVADSVLLSGRAVI